MEGIDRTIDILELFLSNGTELGITQMAELSGLSPAVTHRIVTSLLKRGYIFQKEKKGKYSLGYKFLAYSNLIRKYSINNGPYHFLQAFVKEINESVLTAKFYDKDIVCVEYIEADHVLKVNPIIGRKMPIHCTAPGKLLLTQLSKPERRLIFSDPSLPKFTKNTKTDIKLIEKELELYKIEGCTFDREESQDGIWSVAAPYYNSSGKMSGAISTMVPTTRVNKDNIQKLTSATKLCAFNISRTFGYSDNRRKSSND